MSNYRCPGKLNLYIGTGWRVFSPYVLRPPGPYDFLEKNEQNLSCRWFPSMETFCGGGDPVLVREFLFPVSVTTIIDLSMGFLEGPFSTMAGCPKTAHSPLLGRFPSFMGRFPTLMGRFPKCVNGPFSVLKILWKTLSPLRKGQLRSLWYNAKQRNKR